MEQDPAAITRLEKYRRLVDEFYEQNKDFVSEEEYEQAKTDPEQLRVLIKRVTDLYQKIGRELLIMDRNIHAWEKQFKKPE
jgi:hypothetical protein